MTTLTATFRIVTPMFLAGANQTKAELRAPSIKGALRFWWRALQWGKVGDISKLREKEANLFGSAEGGQSRVLLSIPTSTLETAKSTPWQINNHTTGWKCYSGYGLHEGKRTYLKPDQEFQLLIGYHSLETAELEGLSHALQLLGLVGGLGSRTRNGWGSVTLVDFNGYKPPKDASSLKTALEQLLGSSANTGPISGVTKYTQWTIGKPNKDSEKAHRWIVERCQSIRNNDEVSKLDRVELGLPRRSKGLSKKDQNKRRASPLLLHVHQARNGKAIPLAFWLPSDPWHPEIKLPGSRGKAPKAILEEIRNSSI